jgi:hypothetical protein
MRRRGGYFAGVALGRRFAVVALSVACATAAPSASGHARGEAAHVAAGSPRLTLLLARPGGGQSFSSGSRSSSSSSRSSGSSSSSSRSSGSRSSGGSSGSDDFFGLIGFLLSTGVGGFGFFGGLIVLLVISQMLKRRGIALNWQAGVGQTEEPRTPVRRRLEALRAQDPNFSLVLFEDFLYALYAQAETLRGGAALERLSPYLKPPARGTLTALGEVREVRSIIVGAMRYRSVDGLSNDGPTVWVGIEFETNYTEILASGAEQSFYACEQWMLSRAKAAQSRTPDRARVFVCPSCGAPLDTMSGGLCKYCQATVDTGQFDWVVETIEVTSREARGPLLTGTTEETGTNLPSVYDPDVTARFAELGQRDPGFAWPMFQSRVAMIHGALQASWSGRDWAAARPFVSDNLFQMYAYWIEAYKKARLRNVTEGARVEQIELVRATSDKFFDALTVRLFASSLDYTIADDGGKVVGGNQRTPRRYSEYWTLIRSVAKKGPTRIDLGCPSCGAPLQVEMAGNCVYCRAKVTSGDFDWVLSRIEQDDVYDG